jgi:cytochrome P450
MANLRESKGDVLNLDLRPVLPPTYILMGKAANRFVLEDADPSLEQVLQQLINVLPVAANVPPTEDKDLQLQVARFFQSERVVDDVLPSFVKRAEDLRDRWVQQGPDVEVPVFLDLSEYVLLANFDLLYGKSFTEKYSERIMCEFNKWLLSIAKGGNPYSFFKLLGELLTEEVELRRSSPEEYKDEDSVLQIYLDDRGGGALDRHGVQGVVGLLSMTLMAAVFNVQVSIAWILVHLYSDPELLKAAREELEGCGDLTAARYQDLAKLEFANSCIEEAVRLHAMLPGNTVVRRAKKDVTFHDGPSSAVHIQKGDAVWLYPNAVHLDEQFYEEPKAFCPYRMMSGGLERMSAELELVTFGHGQKRCIGEKMARAMVCTFLGSVLPSMDAQPPSVLPAENFFDLIPASQLYLKGVKPRDRPPSPSAAAR